MTADSRTALHKYVETDDVFYQGYEDYAADIETLQQVVEQQPLAHVIVPCRTTCGDCARNVPKMTRIAEYLPGWTWDIFDSSDEDNSSRMAELEITHVPTFIIYSTQGGDEIGRIVENPVSGSLEIDLLNIVADERT